MKILPDFNRRRIRLPDSFKFFSTKNKTTIIKFVAIDSGKSYILRLSVHLCLLHSIRQQHHQVESLNSTYNQTIEHIDLTFANARRTCAGKGVL